MRYYLDEQYSDVIADICRSRGVDARTTHEAGRDGTFDDSQLLFAGEEGRAMVTENREDFEYWTEHFRERGLPHAGVILVPPSIKSNEYREIAEGLIYLDSLYPDGLPPYTVIWLMRPPRPIGSRQPGPTARRRCGTMRSSIVLCHEDGRKQCATW